MEELPVVDSAWAKVRGSGEIATSARDLACRARSAPVSKLTALSGRRRKNGLRISTESRTRPLILTFGISNRNGKFDRRKWGLHDRS